MTSVAIAIRGAMTNYFTNSKFMILDIENHNKGAVYGNKNKITTFT